MPSKRRSGEKDRMPLLGTSDQEPFIIEESRSTSMPNLLSDPNANAAAVMRREKLDCVNPGHGAAKVFCTNCSSSYCETCFTSHTLSPHIKGHKVKPIDDVSTADSRHTKSTYNIELCTQHWQPVKYVCKKCTKRICTVCCVFLHMEHDIAQIGTCMKVKKKKKKKHKNTKTETVEHTGKPDVVCINEDHGSATVFCKDCPGFYCEICSALHQNFDSISTHAITPIHEMSQHDIECAQASVDENSCAEHRQPLRHMCMTCSKLVCKTCAMCKHADHVIDKISGQTPIQQTEQILCFKIDHGSASIFCINCNEFYCQDCCANHQQYDAMTGHKIISINSMNTLEIAKAKTASIQTCTKHNEPISSMCITCNMSMCKDCHVDHHDHHLQNLTKTATESFEKLEKMMNEKEDWLAESKDLLHRMEKQRKIIVRDMTVAKKEIQTAAQRIRDIIDSHERDLIHKLEEHKASTLTTLECLENEYKMSKSAAETFTQDIQRLRDFGKHDELVKHIPLLQEHLRSRKAMEQHTMTWKNVRSNTHQITESIKDILGNIRLTKHITLGNPVKRTALKYPDKQVVSGMVVVGDVLCVTHTKDYHVWLYDMVSGNSTKCRVPGLKSPCGMAVLKSYNRTVVITDQHNSGGRLQYVKILANLNISHIKEKKIPLRQPRKICYSSTELLVGQVGRHHFLICNAEGNEQRQLTLSKDHFPRCVARTQDGYVALTWDRDQQCTIEWMDQVGRCSHTYCCNDGDNFQKAHHMVVDKEGRIILADLGNDKIHLIDPSGRLLQFLLTKDDGMLGPMCVYVDEEAGLFYVAHGQIGAMEVSAYRWPNGNPSTTNYELELDLF